MQEGLNTIEAPLLFFRFKPMDNCRMFHVMWLSAMSRLGGGYSCQPKRGL